MLGREHALLEGCGRIAFLNGNLGLSKHLSRVELLGDDMHGATMNLIAGLDRTRMCVESAILRKQRRMDIEDPPAPIFDKPWGEDAHEPGESDRSHLTIIKRRAECSIELLLVDTLAVPRPGGEALRPCPVEAVGVRVVRGHEHDF